MKTIQTCFFFVLFFSFSASVFAQNSRSSEGNAPTEKVEIFELNKKKPKIKKSDLPKVRYAKDRNLFLEKRMEEKRENAADMKKPQYTNKLYFGHKKPPKKRPIGKRRFCKECGLTH